MWFTGWLEGGGQGRCNFNRGHVVPFLAHLAAAIVILQHPSSVAVHNNYFVKRYSTGFQPGGRAPWGVATTFQGGRE